MSRRMISWALSLPDVHTEEMFVLAAIGAWSDDSGRFLSSLAPLAKRCSLPEDELRATLARLASKGLVDLEPNGQADDLRIRLKVAAQARSDGASAQFAPETSGGGDCSQSTDPIARGVGDERRTD